MSQQSLLKTPTANQWKKIGIHSHHGINVPLFALHSEKSAGIGEFLDLKLLIDWIKPLGFDLIQLLPLNASGQDPSPYNAISAHALNIIYLSLHALPGIEKHSDLIYEIEHLRPLSNTDRVQYARVKAGKERILRLYFQREGKEIERDPAYRAFQHKNPWLGAYAKFKALKTHHQWKHWQMWASLPAFEPSEEEISYHSMAQFLAFQQMQSVKAYAEKCGVFLMGDIPILVSPDSADVWDQRQLFHLELAAGAPPDMYSQEGQHWGFPLYNYAEMEKEGFRFWKERLCSASELYHLYRIDHIVGFFRIWAIPEGKPAKEGHFIPSDASRWKIQGEKVLKFLIENSLMLPIGEDLGVIPSITRATMHALGIAGTKVIRWERHWDGNHGFIPYKDYPCDSLTTVSTHDSEILTHWWKTHPEEAKAFAHFKHWHYATELSRLHLRDILYDSHHTPSLFHVNLLNEYLSLFPELINDDPSHERINIPGIVSPHNWTYRFKPSLEALQKHPELAKVMRELLL